MRNLDGGAARSSKNEALVVKERAILTPKDKANAFKANYAEVSRYKLSREDRNINRNVRKALSADDVMPDCRCSFSKVELEKAIKCMRTKGASGDDQIAPRMISHLGERGKEILLTCLNRSWEEGYCPQGWRNATIIPLLKTGKPSERLDSFRPVSLTSCVAKTLERMVANRLRHIATPRQVFVGVVPVKTKS